MPTAHTRRRRTPTALPRLALLGALLFALPLGARAATFTVSSLGDDAADATTLRGAITASEASTDTSDTINITATGTITLAANKGTIFVYNGKNVAGKTLAIVGPGSASLAVDGGGTGGIGVFYFGNTGSGDIAASVSGLTIQNGADTNGGAGIFDTQTLTLTDVVLSGNATTGGIGGGLYSFGAAVTMTDCVVDSNSATVNGSGGNGTGGGIYANGGSLTMTDCTVSSNSAKFDGGIKSYQSTLSMTGCIVDGNSASSNAGGLESDGPATLTNCVFSNNTAANNTGGMDNNGPMTMTDCTVIGNSAPGSGGGLYNQAPLTAVGDTFSGNTAGYGAGVFNYLENAADGAALSSSYTGCTFDSNSAGQEGGGVFVYTDDGSQGGGSISVTLTNCTVSGNSAGGDFGGGLYVQNTDNTTSGTGVLSATLVNCTVSGNTAPSDGGGLDFYGFSKNGGNVPTCTVTSSIIAGNALTGNVPGTDPDYNTDGPALLTSGGSNLIGVGTAPDGFIDGTNHDRVGTTDTPLDPRLDVLADNGGPAMTLALLAGSPALDADYNSGVADDGRGLPRPSGVRSDIGAFEYQSPTAVPDAYSTFVGAAKTVAAPGVLANDTAPSGAALAAVLGVGPAHGTLSLNADGSFTYTPDAGFAGTDTFTYRAGDGVGLSAPATVTLTVQDVTAPVTAAALDPAQPNGTNGVYDTAVTVTLAATDDASGVAATTYSIDGGAATPYAGAFTVTGNGPHTVSYSSTDKAGNAEAAKTTAFTISITTPVTTASLAGPQGTDGYYTGDVTVTLTAKSASSTVSGTFYSVDGGAQQTYTAPFAVSGDSAHTVTFHSTDAAGDTEAPQTVTAKIDAVAPTTTAGASGPQNGAGVYTGAVSVTLAATDDFAGVAATTYSVDGGAAMPYTAPFPVGTNGAHTVTFGSTDKAGNAEATKTFKFSVELPPSTPPVAHTFPAGLQLFSVPADYSAVPLGTALSQNNPTLAVWVPAALQYALSPTAPADALRPGQGYWARFGQATSLYDLGTPTPTDKPFAISLRKAGT